MNRHVFIFFIFLTLTKHRHLNRPHVVLKWNQMMQSYFDRANEVNLIFANCFSVVVEMCNADNVDKISLVTIA